MSIEIKAPTFPESVTDGTIATWHKQAGEAVGRDELIVDIETDKVVLEVVAPEAGILAEIVKAEGDIVLSGELIGRLEKGTAVETDSTSAAPVAQAEVADVSAGRAPLMGPAARQLAQEHNLDASGIEGTGKGGRVTKEDVLNYIKTVPAKVAPASAPAPVARVELQSTGAAGPSGERVEKRVPMTRMRTRIAERLLGVSRETAMLTTFNEVNMKPVMDLRAKYREQFEKTHNGTRLGFMGLFVKVACEALKRHTVVNASIDGDDVVYHGYQDVGVAVSTDKGLVVPVLRDADFMSIADIEAKIRDFGMRAKEGKLSIEEMQGGTFTITNGGVFGSLMSTPILNPPQTGILGMHKIQERPMAVNGEVVILPMMYLALSYDHRLVDGKDAVQFLVAIKELLEDPARILLQL